MRQPATIRCATPPPASTWSARTSSAARRSSASWTPWSPTPWPDLSAGSRVRRSKRPRRAGHRQGADPTYLNCTNARSRRSATRSPTRRITRRVLQLPGQLPTASRSTNVRYKTGSAPTPPRAIRPSRRTTTAQNAFAARPSSSTATARPTTPSTVRVRQPAVPGALCGAFFAAPATGTDSKAAPGPRDEPLHRGRRHQRLRLRPDRLQELATRPEQGDQQPDSTSTSPRTRPPQLT